MTDIRRERIPVLWSTVAFFYCYILFCAHYLSDFAASFFFFSFFFLFFVTPGKCWYVVI